MPSQSATCRRCQATFIPTPNSHGWYCSRVCADRHRVEIRERRSCEHCGRDFTVYAKKRLFCSQGCAREAQRAPALICGHCEQSFRSKVRGQQGQQAIYCSRACVWAAAAIRQTKICAHCGTQFRARLYRSRPASALWLCSRACAAAIRDANRPVRECSRCRNILPRSAFYRRTTTSPRGYCKRCQIDEHAERRALVLGNAVLGPIDFEEIERRDRWRCWLCGHGIQRGDLNYDHAIPIVAGGEHSTRNLRMTHGTCNKRKKDRLVTHQPFLI